MYYLTISLNEDLTGRLNKYIKENDTSYEKFITRLLEEELYKKEVE